MQEEKKEEATPKKSHKFIIIIILLLAIWGLYKHVTKLPDGSMDTDTIWEHNAKIMDSFIFAYGVAHPLVMSTNDKVVYLYKNTRTKRYVFPIKDLKTHKTHFCYLESVDNAPNKSMYAIDISNKNWCRQVVDKVAKVKGHNPAQWQEKMSINYYSENVSNLDTYYHNNVDNNDE
ncbi:MULTISPECIES: hypothetical protein [Lactobacillaceae]|uniref:Uncharacterized protein n=1 Tax=Loigolactobacillus coryniformis subsp. torquens DSM 20004 = KCTC 3535 TaxID=1423822 RepID=A0A2D1KKG8_9LACO|nr:hypothetical protein [Loigolactobacillus coryniformis]ATO42633.1 hypothetical protein LC20004_01280 [Loigolactobacillus coryniformis subsp. torquens DSM 20004 = KCTC 3535]KRK74437.1 hypothetical protein FC16_GL000563 [Loigolactobacillus coryniformis subsp. torquens DSM 20004 = KCTC 3535]